MLSCPGCMNKSNLPPAPGRRPTLPTSTVGPTREEPEGPWGRGWGPRLQGLLGEFGSASLCQDEPAWTNSLIIKNSKQNTHSSQQGLKTVRSAEVGPVLCLAPGSSSQGARNGHQACSDCQCWVSEHPTRGPGLCPHLAQRHGSQSSTSIPAFVLSLESETGQDSRANGHPEGLELPSLSPCRRALDQVLSMSTLGSELALGLFVSGLDLASCSPSSAPQRVWDEA
ncbi:hypothetical protein TREES_T100007840 [Tupaia chinensis]|uniref:Uncharacterized protein n=1 Tax=Tupaia chinensis TaxID=246437 RepID=L9K8G9_TUPCH|nr:hypothetical protein TREES_T100007840 [Tupaia chinensis]